METKKKITMEIEKMVDLMCWSYTEGYNTAFQVLGTASENLTANLKEDMGKALESLLEEKELKTSSIVSPYDK